jgi:hypothetical protein
VTGRGGPVALSALLAASLLLSACVDTPAAEPTTTARPTTTTTSPTVIVESTIASDLGCPAGTAFVDREQVARLEQPTTDTSSIGLISWGADGGCETFDIAFETAEGAPATTPPTVVVDFLDTRQVLRVWLDVDASVITDQLVETSLVDRLYVVRSLDDEMFIDFHLIGPAQARVDITTSPAHMTLELQRGTDPFVAAPAIVSDQVVVTEPTIGTETGAAVDVAGYARTFEANVLLIATVEDTVVAESSVTAADWAETWGEFAAPLVLPEGQVELFVGEESPTDGGLVGVTLNLTIR